MRPVGRATSKAVNLPKPTDRGKLSWLQGRHLAEPLVSQPMGGLETLWPLESPAGSVRCAT